jgi:competence protein ComEA
MKLKRNLTRCLKSAMVCLMLAMLPAVFAADVATQTTMPLERVDINSADATTLAQVMDGVGIVKAQEIVAHRELNGKFQSVDQLMEVSGIGLATVEKNRHLIMVITN